MEMAREQLMASIDDFARGVFGPHLRRGSKPPDMDLTIGQLECLRLIGHLGTPSMSELCQELQLQPSTMTGLVDGLVQRGKVERVEDPDDRRVVRVRMTAQGLRERDHIRRHRRDRLRELLGGLDDGDLERLHEIMARLHAAALSRWEQCPGETRDGGGTDGGR